MSQDELRKPGTGGQAGKWTTLLLLGLALCVLLPLIVGVYWIAQFKKHVWSADTRLIEIKDPAAALKGTDAGVRDHGGKSKEDDYRIMMQCRWLRIVPEDPGEWVILLMALLFLLTGIQHLLRHRERGSNGPGTACVVVGLLVLYFYWAMHFGLGPSCWAENTF